MGVSRLCGVVCILLLTMTPGVLTQDDNDLREPPNIEVPKEAETKFQVVDGSITLPCTATGKPTPTYEWRFKDALVTSQHPPGGNVSFDQSTGVLKINGLQKGQTGLYNCRAINTHATAMSPSINIQMSSLAPTWPDIQLREVSGTQGDYLEMRCDSNLPEHSGTNNFKWYRRSQKNIEMTPTDRIFIDEKGTLHFTSLEVSDDEDDLAYSCALSNALSGSIVMGSRVNLIVSSIGSVSQVKPQLKYRSGVRTGSGPYTVTWVKGQPGRLECFFSGNPVPTVTWKQKSKVSSDILNNDHFQIKENGRVLEMEDVSLDDDTTFWCTGTNSQGTGQGEIRVNVTSAPVWVQPLETKIKPQVQNVPFHCKAKSMYGERAPDLPVWFKNGETMAKRNTSEHLFSPDGRTLTVLSVTKDKSIACYQCLVRNSVGELYGQGCLNVVLPLTIITRPPSEQEITKGDVINFTVVATSDPLFFKALTYEWEFRNKTYTKEASPPFVVYDIWSRRATLNTSKLNDEQLENITGLYRRFVYHVDPSPYQRQEIDVMVTLKVEPGPAAAGFQYWIIGLILAIIIILLVLIICCCVICRRKMQEGDYPVDRKETAAGLDPEKEVKEGGFPDLSRAPDDNPKKPGQFDMDGQSLRDDESFASTEYGGEEFSRFNEDGSFLGAYVSKDKDKNKQSVDNPSFQPPRANNNAYIYDSGNESRV
ncbi:hypothetical protein ACOMHN_056434 [Nucella lapillus]